jgi:hypothetical protein
MDSNDQLEKELQEKLEELSPKGSLFESITYYNEEQLNQFLSNMTQEQAIYCLMEAVKVAYRRGSYKLEESEAISKSLRVLGAS